MSAQKHDTLQTVRIPVKKERNISTAPTPLQIFTREDLEKRNSISVADAVKQFAGVQVKDYGGIGGLKTVSVRSLGANHTGVMYDGLLLGDAQGGQADLGKFSLDNVQQVQLYNAGPAEILLPARAFSSAALLLVNTVSASQKDFSRQMSLGIRQGSFGYLSPYFSLRSSSRKKFSTGISGTYQQATGNYPFISYSSTGVPEKRINSGIKAFRLEYDAVYQLNDSDRVLFKTYYYHSNMGLPGAIILYNTGISNQTLKDENIFIQAKREKTISAKSRLLLSAKYSADNYFYKDPAYPNSFGKLENTFHQREIYFSAAYQYQLNPAISIAAASDLFNSRLRRSDFLAQGFANPNRNSFLNNLALRFLKNNVEASGNLLYTVINEKTSLGKAGRNLRQITPAVAASVAPFSGVPIRIRAFYKRIFRAPTFNDLYYTNIGNTDLRPEYADQYNAGISYSSGSAGLIKKIIFTGDAYLNTVTDKILAVPRQNLFQWSMQNIGSVRIKGADIGLHLDFNSFKNLGISSDISYGLQEALDVTDKSSPLYRPNFPIL
ncbi:MAG: TonB-dependent receptor [Ferruginibacter sp.]